MKKSTTYNKIPHGCAQADVQAHMQAHVQAQRRNPDQVLNILIACEESQAECTAFRQLGHLAFSCDIQSCRQGGHPEWHVMGDVTPLLQTHGHSLTFDTMDGQTHNIDHWDLIIAHPPCTYLCRSSGVCMYIDGEINHERKKLMNEARKFFFTCLNADAPYVAVENPVPLKMAQLPQPSCYIQPSWYGVKYTKKTLYWLKNLPPLFPTVEHPHPRCYVRNSRGKYRSRTFPQVAEAIATQWTDYILNDKIK